MEVFSPLEVLFVTVGSDWLLAGRGKSRPMRISGCNTKRRAIAGVGFMYIVISKLRHNYHAWGRAARRLTGDGVRDVMDYSGVRLKMRTRRTVRSSFWGPKAETAAIRASKISGSGRAAF